MTDVIIRLLLHAKSSPECWHALSHTLPDLSPLRQALSGSPFPMEQMMLELNPDMCALYLRIWLLSVTAHSYQGHHCAQPPSGSGTQAFCSVSPVGLSPWQPCLASLCLSFLFYRIESVESAAVGTHWTH